MLVHGVPIYVRHDQPAVEAIGIVGGVVITAGPLAAVRHDLPEGTRELRLPNGAVTPAFIDAHQHAFLVAVDPFTDSLYRRARAIPELLRVLAALIGEGAQSSGDAPWLRFHGYEPLFFTERRSPRATELDQVCSEHPLHVLSRTFHESAVNSAGLDALGISRDTPDPPGGCIQRDRRGRPTGVLLEAASFSAEAASRPQNQGQTWHARLVEYGRMLLSHGITRIGDAAVPADVASQVVSALASVGVDAHPLLIAGRIDEPAFLEGSTAKVLADGGEYCHLCMTGTQVRAVFRASVRANLGNEAGLARAVGRRAGFPHLERDGRWHTGIRYPQEADFQDVMRSAAEVGSALAVHAIGNGAVEAVLRSATSDPGLLGAVPLRVEHAMAIGPNLVRQLGGSAVPVVAQPGFLSAFGHELNIVSVPDPLRLMPFRTMLDAGVPLAFSSDFPAASISPWHGVMAAVTRDDSTGGLIHADEAITVAEALTAYTTTAAQVLGLADVGSLVPGMRADLIWCDRDPHTSNPDDLLSINTLATWAEGVAAYVSDDASSLVSQA